MICKKCGAENDNDDIFCYQCGNKLDSDIITENNEGSEKKCPKCGHILSEGDLFCDECGTKIVNSINSEIEVTEKADIQSVLNVNDTASSTNTINSNASNSIVRKIILIFIVIVVVIGVPAAFYLSDSKKEDEYSSKIKTVQESSFVFLPDITIGELIHEYYGDDFWIYNVPERCVEYYGDNKKDKSGIDIRFKFVEKNKYTASYVMFNEEGEKSHNITIEEFEKYMTSLYNNYAGDDSMQQETNTTKVTSQLTEETTTTKQTTTEAAQAPDVNYSLYGAAIDKMCLIYGDYIDNCWYTLYDVDKNGVYELILKIGDGSADDKFMFVTIDNGETLYMGEMQAYSVWLSKKRGVLYANMGHNGYQIVQRIDSDGEGIYTETISEGEISGDYTTYGTALETSILQDNFMLIQYYTDPDLSYCDARVETYDYSGLDGSESRLYVEGDFEYIEVEKVGQDETFQPVGTYQKSECADYIDLHFNAYAEPTTKIVVTPFNANGTAGSVNVCVIPKNASDTISTKTIGTEAVDQKGQIAIYDGSTVAGYSTSYVCEGGACTKVRESLGNQWHVTAKNKCFNYGVEWYELWDTDDGDYYGWVDANYIKFY